MRIKSQVSSLVVLISLIITSADAGPFGLSMGAKKSTFTGLENLEKDLYKIKNAPKPHSHFQYYVLKIGDKSGLCAIRAIGKTIDTNRYGTKLKSEFEEMKELLTKKYKKGKTYDFLRSGSIWNEPEDFMTGLTKKERYLAAIWDAKEESKLPSNLKNVSLNAAGLNTEKGVIILEYNFSNIDQCKKEHEAIDADAL